MSTKWDAREQNEKEKDRKRSLPWAQRRQVVADTRSGFWFEEHERREEVEGPLSRTREKKRGWSLRAVIDFLFVLFCFVCLFVCFSLGLGLVEASKRWIYTLYPLCACVHESVYLESSSSFIWIYIFGLNSKRWD